MISKKENSSLFKSGWIGEKTCSICKNKFIANSGAQQKCSNCKKCKQCLNNLKGSYVTFCSNSCAGKWKYKNSEKIQNIIKDGQKKAYTREAINKRILKTTGKPRFNMRGKNNPNYKDGGKLSSERHTLMGRIEYKQWRISVFQRDNYICQFCKVYGGKLEADHIIPYCVNKEKALDINNGRTLCKPCHKKTDTWGNKVHKFKQLYIERKGK